MTKLEVVSEENEGVAPDPFNVAALRLPPSYEQDAALRTQLTTVPVRKPKRQEWIRVHHDKAYRADFALILVDEGREYYLVNPALLGELQNEVQLVTLYVAINKAGVVFLWPVKRPTDDGHRTSDWIQSAHEAAAAAVKRYVRMSSNMALGAYEITFRESPIPEADPTWPDKSMSELLKIAFQNTGRYIDKLDHDLINELRGR
jgi:hypothetical protein